MPQLSLAVLIQGTGVHPASWMLTGTKHDPATDIRYYTHAAQLAERGMFDLFFVADTPAARTENLEAWSRFPLFMNVFEPLTLLSALSGATTHIGLGGTLSTSFYEPYNIARLYASLDHLSNGRAAWNVVTSANDYAAKNFGLDKLPPHADRYARAREAVAVVKALWDSWEAGAFINDVTNGQNFDPSKLHPLSHEGEFFRVNGALNIGRTPQGQPVLIQAGSSNTGKDFAAEIAEVVFSSDATLEAGQAFYKDLKGRMAKFGRDPSQLKILAGLPIVLGATPEEAEAKYRAQQDMIQPIVGKMRLANDLEIDLSGLPIDEPIPEELIPATSNFHQTYFADIVRMIRKKMTLREIYTTYERGLTTFRGTPMQAADHMQEWLEGGAADGFMLIFPAMPSGMQDFVDGVVPELQRRGLLRTEYTSTTLRGHLGLKEPKNRYAAD